MARTAVEYSGMDILYGVAGGVILLLLLQLLSNREKKVAADPQLAEMAAYIDSTLKGYPDRSHTKLHGFYAWTCHSRLFTIQLRLARKGGRYQFIASFFREIPYKITIKSALIGRTLKLTAFRGAATKKLVGEGEMDALLKKLEFYQKTERKRSW